jgi:hypothetical protein
VVGQQGSEWVAEVVRVSVRDANKVAAFARSSRYGAQQRRERGQIAQLRSLISNLPHTEGKMYLSPVVLRRWYTHSFKSHCLFSPHDRANSGIVKFTQTVIQPRNWETQSAFEGLWSIHTLSMGKATDQLALTHFSLSYELFRNHGVEVVQ